MGVLAVLLLVFALLAAAMRRTAQQFGQELVMRGEPPILGPEPAHFAPGEGFGVVRTDGALALTERQLVFRKVLGGEVELPLADIARLGETNAYRGHWRAGWQYIVVSLQDGREAAFVTRNNARWLAELKARTEE